MDPVAVLTAECENMTVQELEKALKLVQQAKEIQQKNVQEVLSDRAAEAVLYGDIQSLQYHISQGFVPKEYFDSRGCGLLLVAAEKGHGEIVEYLAKKHELFLDNVKANDQVYFAHERGVTPLMMAAGGVDISSMPDDKKHPLEFLLDGYWNDRIGRYFKASPQEQDVEGSTALHYAARYGHIDNAWYLLLNGASHVTVNDDGHSFIDVARMNGHENFIAAMREHFQEQMQTYKLIPGTVRAFDGLEVKGFSYEEVGDYLRNWCISQKLIEKE